MKLTLIMLVLALLALSYATGEQDQRPVVLCGRQLANARVLLCYGSEYVFKRGNDNNILESLAENKGDEFDWPWTGRRGALTADWSRYKRDELGLVDQCCLRPCTKEVILNYC